MKTTKTASEMLAELDVQRTKVALWRAHLQAELMLPNPQVTNNGVVVCEGEQARGFLRELIAMADMMDDAGTYLTKAWGH